MSLIVKKELMAKMMIMMMNMIMDIMKMMMMVRDNCDDGDNEDDDDDNCGVDVHDDDGVLDDAVKVTYSAAGLAQDHPYRLCVL